MFHPWLLLLVAAAVAVHLVRRLLYATDVPKIKGLPEAPGLPLLGSLVHLGADHPRVARRWAARYGPVVQARLGNRRVIFVNSYESVRHFWVTHQSALISRPTFYTFHRLVSSSQGFTIGTSPWDESCKRRRKAAATTLNRPSIAAYMPVLDLEATASIKELLQDGKGGALDVDPGPYFQRFALNTSLTLCYGFRLDEGVQGERLREMAHVEREIANFRSTSNNWQDYVPLLRLWGAQNPAAAEYRDRRDVYLSSLLDDLKRRIAEGSDRPCLAGNLLRDPDAELSREELKSVCLSMVSGGLDTVPANIIMCLAFLSSPEGQAVQTKAYEAIGEVYPDGDVWLASMADEKVPYLVALVKETLRFWAVIPINLPRQSIRDIPWEGAVVPAGTTFFMNAYAANYDESRYKMPDRFIPERFLGDNEFTGPVHYSFGAGSRMCAGTHLANRELYTALLRILTAFEVVPARDPADAPILDAIDCNAKPTSLTTDPKPFKIGLKPRDEPLLTRWIAAAEERTAKM
ncbi:phenylacetate 2-hydroxylase [Ophiocordyceps camponoti-floridani]|uniref:Phenylacetate 2-hydroxylase n=1 Tax=Ophiocordyceps camponoti-floridani TaxID=2030778 RepID=A0A8H4VDU3_9HYPO|nr:phenylacetate 2-hydroxylase [Ophiocordyceps camponoti-floridani]